MNGMQLSEREGLELWRRAVTASVRSDAPDLTARQQAILMTIALMPGPHTVRGLAEQLNIAKLPALFLPQLPARIRTLPSARKHARLRQRRTTLRGFSCLTTMIRD